jgi:hypothetical protein
LYGCEVLPVIFLFVGGRLYFVALTFPCFCHNNFPRLSLSLSCLFRVHFRLGLSSFLCQWILV